MRSLGPYIARHLWLSLVVVVVLMAAGAAGAVAAGLVPIRASAGHWAPTEWLLQFAMRRGVVTQSLLAPEPPADLDSERRARLGAGYYELGCRPCHASPGESIPPVARAMTPQPPLLGPSVGDWDARELFFIVKHGIKFTGMPAFPTQQRDDEVWDVVAFLRRLPAMPQADYRRIVWGDRDAADADSHAEAAGGPPDVVVRECARCHGADGRGRGEGVFPKLAGQRLEYLTRAMHAYRDGQRFSGVMQSVAARVPESDRHEALQYFASLPGGSRVPEIAGDDFEEGRVLAAEGVPAQEIPACAECHLSADANPAYPTLAGQDADYLARQLRLMQQRRRGGSEFVSIMHEFVDRLSPRHIEVVTTYFAASTGANSKEPAR